MLIELAESLHTRFFNTNAAATAGACLRFRRRDQFAFGVVNLDFTELLERIGDLLRIADDDYLQFVQVDILTRDSLRLVRSYRRDLLGISVPVIGGQAVELLSYGVLQRRLRKFELQCPSADDGAFRSLEFIDRDFFITNALQFVH